MVSRMVPSLPQTTIEQDLADLQRLLRYVESRCLVAGLRSDLCAGNNADALRRKLYQALQTLQELLAAAQGTAMHPGRGRAQLVG